MHKVAIVYWSGTGNTQSMAESVKQGAEQNGSEVTLFSPADFQASMVEQFDSIAFGCPAMGSEVLEEYDFQPMFDGVKASLQGKSVALFGSYGWGDGEWMRNWEAETKQAGANLVADGVMAHEAPDEEALLLCQALGQKL